MNPAIVVAAYDRPYALERLLASLARGDYPNEPVPLVISIDRTETDSYRRVCALAESFVWRFGPKRVVRHDEHLGLVDHVYYCGDLSEEYGSIVFLEDDLAASPVAYKYASSALSFYATDEKIAGVSLYALWFNGYTLQPFTPLDDGGDVFFLQIPYTQGQAWTSGQWRRFAQWRTRGNITPSLCDPLHRMWLDFDGQDQFPVMTKYLVETGAFYVFPRVSLTTGMGDAGTHFARSTLFFQVPLLQSKANFSFTKRADSAAVYDSFFEILPDRLSRLAPALEKFSYDVDLYATKEPRILHSPLVLTSRECRRPLVSFGRTMRPHEANVVEGTPGSAISLAKSEDICWGRLAGLKTQKSAYEYHNRVPRPGKKLRAQFALLDLLGQG
ncbi:MAG: hypothetical protein M1482_01090 [Chloroflexi bacterium]|nr:hypothetical protein [Chloroflexota bacterium]